MRVSVAISVRGDCITAAILNLSGKLLDQTQVRIAEGGEGVHKIVTGVKVLLEGQQGKIVEGIGICVDPAEGDALRSSFAIESLRQTLASATGLPTVIGNVANACVLGEAWFSGIHGTPDAVVVNVADVLSTGILANGNLISGSTGAAGEFAHVQVRSDSMPCHCGNRGCWNAVASNEAAILHYKRLGGRPIEAFTELIDRADSGDVLAESTLEWMAENLGRGARVIALSLDPKEIVIVGDIARAWHKVGPIADAAMRQTFLRSDVKLRPVLDSHSTRLRGAIGLVLASKDLL